MPVIKRAVPLLFVILTGTHGQQPPLRFEVATLKVSPAGGPKNFADVSCTGGPGTSDPGLYACHYYPAQGLLIEAFGLMPYQIPFDAARDATAYDVVGKVPTGTSIQQFRAMLQQLLVDRLRLAYRFEKKAAPVYDLAVGKNGPKLRESASESVDKPQATDSERDQYGIRNPPANFRGQEIRRSVDVVRWLARGVTTAQMAKRLDSLLQSPVTDSTGLDHRYDFTLYFSAARAGTSAPPPVPGATRKLGTEAAEGVVLPPLAVALENKLGLVLRKKEGFVDLLVVDHINKVPAEN